MSVLHQFQPTTRSQLFCETTEMKSVVSKLRCGHVVRSKLKEHRHEVGGRFLEFHRH
jgi:hypothetical protein